MKKVYYLGFYDTKENKAQKRNLVLAATNKMTYIISALERAGFNVEVVSASWTLDSKGYAAKRVKLGDKSNLTLFKTLPWGNGIKRVISRNYTLNKLKKFLYGLSSKDVLIAYHSVAYADIILKAKRKKGFKLILEAEEIYSDVTGNESERKTEDAIFDAADAFIFPTELLNEKLNTKNKPFSIIYGTYQVEHDRGCKRDDGKIHCVYAGTLDPRKGGAQTAVAVAKYLDSDYVIHILGFGDSADVMRDIESVNELGKGKVIFEGLLDGEDYIRFIQSCHIGLSTQNPDGKFNDTSFPSKVLSYLANGLRVVSCRIKVIEHSAISGLVSMYDENTLQSVATSIRKVSTDSNFDSREHLLELDIQFVSDIKTLLGD